MSSEERSEILCEVCSKDTAVSKCEGCGRDLCKKCRDMELLGSKSLEVQVKYFCPSCSKDPRKNPTTDCKKVLGLEDITDLVNQDNSKSSTFKIKLKIHKA